MLRRCASTRFDALRQVIGAALYLCQFRLQLVDLGFGIFDLGQDMDRGMQWSKGSLLLFEQL